MIKALARAFRWRGMLETGIVATVREIAAAKKTNASYFNRALRYLESVSRRAPA